MVAWVDLLALSDGCCDPFRPDDIPAWGGIGEKGIFGEINGPCYDVGDLFKGRPIVARMRRQRYRLGSPLLQIL